VPDALTDQLSVQRLSVNVAVRGIQTGEVQAKTARTAIPHLHGRKVPPALMIKQG
jgi:hypothetical protein